MPHRDFDDLDSAGAPLDATPEDMHEFINGAIAHRKEQNARLTAVEASLQDIKDGHQVLYKGHRRLEAELRNQSAQMSENTAATKAAAASAAATEENTKDLREAWSVIQQVAKGFEAIGKVLRPLARFISGASWLLVRLGVIGGIGVGGWKFGGDWFTAAIKWVFTGGKP